jgi:hypothetical protein
MRRFVIVWTGISKLARNRHIHSCFKPLMSFTPIRMRGAATAIQAPASREKCALIAVVASPECTSDPIQKSKPCAVRLSDEDASAHGLHSDKAVRRHWQGWRGLEIGNGGRYSRHCQFRGVCSHRLMARSLFSKLFETPPNDSNRIANAQSFHEMCGGDQPGQFSKEVC